MIEILAFALTCRIMKENHLSVIFKYVCPLCDVPMYLNEQGRITRLSILIITRVEFGGEITNSFIVVLLNLLPEVSIF